MNIQQIDGVGLAGVCACVPAQAVANDEKSARATGIVTRRVAADGVRGPVLFAGFGGGLSVAAGAIGIGGDCKLSVVEV